LGRLIVTAMAARLNAEVTQDSSRHGTRVAITFPV
jgi:hypothetical protein